MLHKVAMLTSKVIQLNVFGVSCLVIWWCHEIWISDKEKYDYLENQKGFWSETKKTFFLVSWALFQTYKTN